MYLDSLSASHIANHIVDNQGRTSQPRVSQLQSHPLYPANHLIATQPTQASYPILAIVRPGIQPANHIPPRLFTSQPRGEARQPPNYSREFHRPTSHIVRQPHSHSQPQPHSQPATEPVANQPTKYKESANYIYSQPISQTSSHINMAARYL